MWFKFWKYKKDSPKGNSNSKPKFRELKDVKNGEKIRINGYMMNTETKKTFSQILIVTVLNNNTDDKKIYYNLAWDSGKSETHFRAYDSFELRDFKTLNPVGGVMLIKNTKQQLNDILKEAEQKEDYETSAVLRDAIAKLK